MCKSQTLLCRASLHPAWTHPAISGSGTLEMGAVAVAAPWGGQRQMEALCPPAAAPNPGRRCPFLAWAGGVCSSPSASVSNPPASLCFSPLSPPRTPSPPAPPQAGQAESPCRSRAPRKSPGSASPGACFSSRRHQKKEQTGGNTALGVEVARPRFGCGVNLLPSLGDAGEKPFAGAKQWIRADLCL